ncbi:MAG: hypothetical protein R2710_24400 [Acidimicrobiales bacterium]
MKSGEPKVEAPVYSHLTYDILDDVHLTVCQPDIVIVEGLNVLQTSAATAESPLFVSDFFDFSIYVDADTDDIEQWSRRTVLHVARNGLPGQALVLPTLCGADRRAGDGHGQQHLGAINEKNLIENILPTRERADLILHKGHDHRVTQVKLRRL